ncbi:Putative RNB domain-containing protein [Rhizopus microsporus]|nr:Putative RNB domain-containing protein [Rhizopus microsporus]
MIEEKVIVDKNNQQVVDTTAVKKVVKDKKKVKKEEADVQQEKKTKKPVKKKKNRDTVDPAETKKNRSKPKKKSDDKKPTAVEHAAVLDGAESSVIVTTLDYEEDVEGEVEVFDYHELEEALGGPVKLHDLPSIQFAPETKKKKSKPIMQKSRSAPSESIAKNPSAKNGKYSAVPPPQSLLSSEKPVKSQKVHTHDHQEKKKKRDKEHESESVKPTATKKKTRKIKAEEVEFKVSAPSVKLPAKKEKGTSTDQKPRSTKSSGFTKRQLGEDVKPVVLAKKEGKDMTKNLNEEQKKELLTVDYCHPYDVLYGRKSRMRFERYLDPKICEKRAKEKETNLYKGILRINKRNRTDAYVTTDKLESDIFIFGLRDRNRALEGDTVFVELVDVDTVWAKKKDGMTRKKDESDSVIVDEKSKPKYAGKVVCVQSVRKDRLFSGTISIQRASNGINAVANGNAAEEETDIEAVNELVDDDEGQETVEGSRSSSSDKEIEPKKDNHHVRVVWFKPLDKRAPLIMIPVKNAPYDILDNEAKYTNLIVVVKITRWPIDSLNPIGAFVRELGHIGNIPAETEAILADNGISELPFSKKALSGLPPTPWSIEQSEIDKRRDLRTTRIFTIDPATAKDLDDAVHVTQLDKDNFEVGVHIADVSHFVKQHTALDHEAFDRGTSTYLCDRVIPMLPSLLCEELCSLNPGVDRLAFSVIWKMDSAGNVKETWFGKTIIRSCAKLAYDDAQNVIEGHGLPKTVIIRDDHKVSDVEQDILYLFEMSKKMRERRFANGALSINSIRLSFKLNDIGEPCEVSIYEQKDANRLIEEFMLRANMSVAEKIREHYPNEALLRQHSPPHEKSLNEFLRIVDSLGYKFDGSTAGSLQESFNSIESEDVKSVLKLLAVKPMQRAKYFCTGSFEDINRFRHYALNVPYYTHFTSPIRRFADIVVHRQLEAALANKKSCGYKKAAVQKAAGHCNERKEGAKNSQDMNLQLYLYHYLYNLEKETKKPVICTAIVTQVLKDAIDILVPEYGLEKRLHVDAIPIERYVFDGNKTTLSVYWKEGVDSSWEWDQKRRSDQDFVEPVGTQIELDDEQDNDDENNEVVTVKIPEELLEENTLDRETRMQTFKTFSKLNVRIQVNVERSPPIVNIYPINPFM